MYKITFLAILAFLTIRASQSQKPAVVQDAAYQKLHIELEQLKIPRDVRALIAGYIGSKLRNTDIITFDSSFLPWAISPDGRYLARNYYRHNIESTPVIYLHDMHKKTVHTQVAHKNQEYEPLVLLEFIDDKQLLSGIKNCLKVWSIPELKCLDLKRFKNNIRAVQAYNSQVSVVLDNNEIRIIDYKTNTCTQVTTKLLAGGSVHYAAFTDNGKALFIFYAGSDNSEVRTTHIRLYDLINNIDIAETVAFNLAFRMCAHPTKKIVAYAVLNDNFEPILSLWNAETGAIVSNEKDFKYGLETIRFMPHSNDLACMKVSRSGRFYYEIAFFDSKELVNRGAHLSTHQHMGNNFDFAKNRPVLVAKLHSQQLALWDISLDLEQTSRPIANQKFRDPRSKFWYVVGFAILLSLVIEYCFNNLIEWQPFTGEYNHA